MSGLLDPAFVRTARTEAAAQPLTADFPSKMEQCGKSQPQKSPLCGARGSEPGERAEQDPGQGVADNGITGTDIFGKWKYIAYIAQ